jgi:N-methylhydantoinase A
VSTENLSPIQGHLQALQQAGTAWSATEHLTPAQYTCQFALDMRYVGQNFELSVRLDETVLASLHDPSGVMQLRALFFAAHERHYGYHNPDDPVEIINYRLTARGRLHQPADSAVAATAPAGPPPTPIDRREVYFNADQAVATPVFARASLPPGHSLSGPAVIDQLDATTLLYPGDTLRVDRVHNLCIEVSL